MSINNGKYVWQLVIANFNLPITPLSQVVFAGSDGPGKIDYSPIVSVVAIDEKH
jgi:hypothetical protein